MKSFFRKTFVEVNLANLNTNLESVMSVAGPGRFVCPMIKANAYGHGAVSVAQSILKNYALPLGVVLIEEALQLRQAGIQSEILVFGGFDLDGARKIVEAKLTPVVSQFEHLEYLNTIATEPLNIHIKFNTGMSRLGFSINEAEKVFQFLKDRPKIQARAILSHLHTSQLLDQPNSSSLQQVKSMIQLMSFFKELGVFGHVLNSDGIGISAQKNNIAELRQYQWGFRPGIMLYGYCDERLKIKSQLKPVMTLRSCIQNIQKIKSGETVSYNATWTAKKDSLIGIVPIGYADGIHRIISNRGRVFIQDQMVPIVGKVCMDFFMVDLTEHKKSISLDSEIIVFGEKSTHQIQDAADFAKSAETISYEALTSISARVPRLYIGENS